MFEGRENQNDHLSRIYSSEHEAKEHMDWMNRLRKAVEYLEDHLSQEYSVAEAAKAGNVSEFHFQRTFAVITEMSVGEYVRRRRLTLAAQDLLSGAEILDTALKWGYESQAAFTRAFRSLHGVTPGAVGAPGVLLKSFPPLSFRLEIVGAESMDYSIQKKGPFRVAGVVKKFTTQDNSNFKEIPQFWEKCNGNGVVSSIMDSAWSGGVMAESCCLGICMEFEENSDVFSYMIGSEVESHSTSISLPEGMEWATREIPEATWAVFPGEGAMPESMQMVWKRIFAEWFPTMDYVHAPLPELEVYRCHENGHNTFEIWIPVEKAV